jgi:hypothetical protein
MIRVSKIVKDGRVLAERTAVYARAHDGRLKVNNAGGDLVRKGERLRFCVQGLHDPWEGEVLWYDQTDGWIVLWTPELPARVSLLHPSLGWLTEAVEREGSMEDHLVDCRSRQEAIAALEAGHLKASGATIVGDGMGRLG